MIEVLGNPEEVPVWTDAINDRPVDWAALMEGYSPRWTGPERASGPS